MTAPALRCRGLVKRYPDVLAVDGIDLEVRAGECFGLLGPNGAGKTTTVEIFEGVLEPDEGEVEVLGAGWRRDGRRLRDRLGIQLQDTRLMEKLSVLETVVLFRSFHSKGHPPLAVLERVGLVEKAAARVGKLSGGQRQRLALACALVSDPEILFLDEPTTGLDPQSRRKTWEIVDAFRREGGTVLLTTHYMEEAERLCDRVAVIDHGKVIADGSPRQLIASLGAEHVVEFEAGGDLDLQALARLAGVTESHLDGEVFRLSVTEVHETIPALLAELADRGVQLTRLTTHNATLEDVFLALTGRHLRDG